MKKIGFFVMLIAAIVFFSPQTGSAGLTKLWGDGLNISNTGGAFATYGYGRKASDGSLFAYYQTNANYANSGKIYIQKIDKDGHELWGSQGRLVYQGGWGSLIVDLAPDQSGGAVAVFGTGSELRAKRFDSTGNEDTSWGTNGVWVASTVGSNIGPMHYSAVTDGAGGVIVVWQIGLWVGGNWGIYAQRVGSEGQLKWNNGEPVWVGYGGLYHGWTEANNVVPDGNGGVFIAWNNWNNNHYNVGAQHLDSNGVAQWQTDGLTVIPGSTGVVQQGDLVPDGTGGVIITAGGSGLNQPVIAQRIDSTGNLPWGSEGIIVKFVAKACWGPRTTSMKSVGNEEFVIVWDGMEADAVSCDESDIYAQKIDINGNLKWNPDGIIVSDKNQFDYLPHVTTDGGSGVWISFVNGNVQNDIWDGMGYIAVQHIDNDGNVFACSPIRQQTYNHSTWDHSLIPDNEGGVYSLWDGVLNYYGDEVYAQRFTKVGTREVCGVITVTIDIKPGSYPNAIKLQDTGNIPVAIFSSDTFDASAIDVASLELNGAGVRIVKGKGLQYSFEDVNGDGLLDLMVHFDRGALQLTIGDTTATVTGMTLDGKHIQGADSVKVIE